MHPITAKLIELERLESALLTAPDESEQGLIKRQAQALRAEIPSQILGRYDRLNAAGKTPVAAVVNGTCQGCHLGLSTGALADLLDKEDVHLCQHCGCYIYPERTQRPELRTGSRRRTKRPGQNTSHPRAQSPPPQRHNQPIPA